jgi:hypothetical protein
VPTGLAFIGLLIVLGAAQDFIMDALPDSVAHRIEQAVAGIIVLVLAVLLMAASVGIVWLLRALFT